MHPSWKSCAHGIVRSASPAAYPSRHTAQADSPSSSPSSPPAADPCDGAGRGRHAARSHHRAVVELVGCGDAGSSCCRRPRLVVYLVRQHENSRRTRHLHLHAPAGGAYVCTVCS
ncbi:hypothetical protein SEVIR_8G028450v4 [Setaria viridis]